MKNVRHAEVFGQPSVKPLTIILHHELVKRLHNVLDGMAVNGENLGACQIAQVRSDVSDIETFFE